MNYVKDSERFYPADTRQDRIIRERKFEARFLTIENARIEDVIPSFLLRNVIVRWTPQYTQIVDEDVEL